MKKTATIAILLAVLFTTACTATATRRSFGEGYRDSMTTSKIKWSMGRDKEVRAGDVNVDTWRGKVTLTGVVETEAEKMAAERVARNTKNVNEVRNYIDVVGSSAPVVATKAIDEAAITETKSETKLDTKAAAKTETVADTSVKSVKPGKVKKADMDSDDGYTEVTVTETSRNNAKKLATKDIEPATSKKVKGRVPTPITITTPKVAKPEKAVKTATVRQNAVSYEIGKELAATEDENYYENDNKNVKSSKTNEVSNDDDVTLQAERELMELKAKRGK